MIELKRKQDCCGCTACMSICHKNCISMKADQEGFLYPVTDIDTCINCNACNRVCPVINLKGSGPTNIFPDKTKAYAAYIGDEEIRLKSSSGGIFSALATETLSNGGVVFGASWVGDTVKHVKIDSVENLFKLRGSKYVQSDLGTVLREIRGIVQTGQKVLFSGTPCQIAGLKSFLHKDYEKLLLVEVACHGTPSPKALQLYLNELREQYGQDITIDFRTKLDGNWRDYKVTAYSGEKHFIYEGQKDNIFMKGFLRELYSRPICSECPFKAGVSGADITLADFWGIEEVLPDFPSKSGVSLVLTHTSKGEIGYKSLDDIVYQEAPVSDAIKHNGALLHSEAPHPERSYFFRKIDSTSFSSHVNTCIVMRPLTRIKLKAKAYLKKIAGNRKD